MAHENDPLVTAVIPVYNHEKYVVESIRSIVNQTYRNIELIVINDGSKDRSHEMVLTVVDECKQRFVRFEYINRENIGLSATLNQALGMANGKYFSPLASDDIALPEKFSILVEPLESKGESYAVAFGNAQFIDNEGQRIELGGNGNVKAEGTRTAYGTFLDFYTRNRNFDYKSDSFGTYPTLLAGNYLPAMSAIIKKTHIEEVGGWTRGNLVEDWELWLKLSKRAQIFYVDTTVALYRLHGLNSTSVKTYELNCSSIALVMGEKKYCSENDLMSVWRDSFNQRLLDLVKSRKLFVGRHNARLTSSDLVFFFYSLIRRIVKKIKK